MNMMLLQICQFNFMIHIQMIEKELKNIPKEKVRQLALENIQGILEKRIDVAVDKILFVGVVGTEIAQKQSLHIKISFSTKLVVDNGELTVKIIIYDIYLKGNAQGCFIKPEFARY